MQKIAELDSVGADLLKNEILRAGQPVVLRGLVDHWPAVAQAKNSPTAFVEYLKGFDSGEPVDAIHGPPEIRGRLFYRGDMRGFNFAQGKQQVSRFLDALLAHLDEEAPPAFAIQSLQADAAMPGFTADNVFPLPEFNPLARLWIGNRILVAPHFDVRENIACVVAGTRRFVLFPPDQLPNLYLGPFDFSPAGAPVSMVNPWSPDHKRFPRYRDAEAAAFVAQLEPGDALYIPYMWFHAVESVTALNLLCNYWWNADRLAGSPFDVLMHAALVLGGLPEEHRQIWRGMLDHYVFHQNGEPFAHLRPEHRGALGGLEPAGAAAMKRILAQRLASN